MIATEVLNACAPMVSPVLMQALVRAESAWNPLAIGMDSRSGTVKQPVSLAEAVATAKALTATGRKFSVGLAQIHVSNVKLYGMTWEQAFDACQNLAVGQRILWNFYHRASAAGYSGVATLWAALRGYNSGGVDRAVSDDYANRIFAYMSSAPPEVQIGTAVPAPQRRDDKVLKTSGAAIAREDDGRARPGESADIFQRTAYAGL